MADEDGAYLRHILDGADGIGIDLSGVDRSAFASTRSIRNSVLHELMVIGEASNRLSVELRQRHPSIPWRDIIDLRNRIVHNYFGLDFDLLWKTATQDVPELRRQIGEILTKEFPGL